MVESATVRLEALADAIAASRSVAATGCPRAAFPRRSWRAVADFWNAARSLLIRSLTAPLPRWLSRVSSKALSTSLMQIHKELEEAAWICGRGTLSTIFTVVLPLARPGVVAGMTLLFILSIRELGSSLFLYSSDTMVMAVQLLGFYEGGNLGITAAFSLVQMVLLAVLITITNRLSRGASQNGVVRSG